MKNLNVSLSDDEIKAISCALSVLPCYDFFDGLPPQLTLLPAEIIMKLNTHKHPNAKETYLVALAIDSAAKALQGEISIKDDAILELRQHSLSIEKLAPLLSPLLDSI